MRSRDHHPLSAQYAALFRLLKETEPIAEKYDVEWWGPCFIPRTRQWHRSRFQLYGGRLFCSVEAGWTIPPAGEFPSSGAVNIKDGGDNSGLGQGFVYEKLGTATTGSGLNEVPLYYIEAAMDIPSDFHFGNTVHVHLTQTCGNDVADLGATPVPEPGTMILLGSGLVGLAGWGRKKFRK